MKSDKLDRSRSSPRCGACSQAERRWRLPLYGVLRGDGGGMDPVRAWRRNRLPPKVRAICSPKIPSSLFKYSIRAPHPTLDSVTMSRQAQKGAAAAAMRNQLKVDAARVKAAAARKDAAQLPEQRSSCKAMHLPEQLRPARRRACGWMWRS